MGSCTRVGTGAGLGMRVWAAGLAGETPPSTHQMLTLIVAVSYSCLFGGLQSMLTAARSFWTRSTACRAHTAACAARGVMATASSAASSTGTWSGSCCSSRRRSANGEQHRPQEAHCDSQAAPRPPQQHPQATSQQMSVAAAANPNTCCQQMRIAVTWLAAFAALLRVQQYNLRPSNRSSVATRHGWHADVSVKSD